MNHTFYDADRTTHLKIVVVALFAAVAVAAIGISARVGATDGATQTAERNSGPAVKAGKAVVLTTSNQQVVR